MRWYWMARLDDLFPGLLIRFYDRLLLSMSTYSSPSSGRKHLDEHISQYFNYLATCQRQLQLEGALQCSYIFIIGGEGKLNQRKLFSCCDFKLCFVDFSEICPQFRLSVFQAQL